MLPQITSTPRVSNLYTLGNTLISPIKDKSPIAPGQPMSNPFRHKSIHFSSFLWLWGYLLCSLIRPLFKVMCAVSNPNFSVSDHPFALSPSLPQTPLHSMVPCYTIKSLTSSLRIFHSLRTNILPLPSPPLYISLLIHFLKKSSLTPGLSVCLQCVLVTLETSPGFFVTLWLFLKKIWLGSWGRDRASILYVTDF